MTTPSYFNRTPMTRLAIGVVLSVIGLSCIEMPLEPILPASDVQLSLPLIDRTRTVADMFTKDTSMVKQNSAGYYYQDDRTFKPTGIDTIKVTPQSSSNQVGLGRLTVPGLPTQNSSVTANQLFSGPFPMDVPALVPLPGANVTVGGASMQDTVNFDFLHISSGTMTVSVTNTLPMDVTFLKPLVIRNNKKTAPVDTSIVASFVLGTVISGQTKPVSASLGGILMRGALQTDSISIQTASKQGPFTIKSTDGISFGFGTSPLLVDSAAAKIPQQNLISVNDSTITLDPTAVLSQALFSKGKFSLSVNNQTGLLVGARMKFNNFVKAISPFDTLTIDTTLVGHQNFSFPVDLANYRVVNGTPGTLGGTSLRFSMGIRTVNSAGVKSTVTFNDFVQAAFLPQGPVVVKSLTGRMNPMTVAIYQGVSLAGLGTASKQFTGSFSFDSLQLNVKIRLSGGFPVFHNLTLYAKKFSSPTLDSLNIPSGTVVPNTAGIITLGNAQGLSTFLGKTTSSFPDTMFLRGSVVVNPGGVGANLGTIADTTKVYPAISTIIPLKLGLLGGQYADVIGIGANKDSSFSKDVKSGTLYFSITNGLPIALQFRAAFMGIDTSKHPNKRDTLLWMPVTAGGNTYPISGATVDASGAVPATGPKMSAIQFSLVTAEVLRLLQCDSVFVQLKINTSGTNTSTTAQPVRIRPTDAITIRASGSVVYTVNKKK